MVYTVTFALYVRESYHWAHWTSAVALMVGGLIATPVLVGLHATHVVVGLVMLSAALIFLLRGEATSAHAERLEVLSLYWHFVDGVWVIVFTVVYIVGR